MNNKYKIITIVMITIMNFAAVHNASAGKSEERLPAYLRADEKNLAKWRDLKFGWLISWGPVSLTGKDLGWSRYSRQRFDHGEIPDEVYDNLYTNFNPVLYNAKEWVKIAEDSGARYMIHVTKHHDGFCNFDTKLTDYKITSPKSPYGKDIVKQLADACHEAKMKFGVYYSQPDWKHPDFFSENHSRYVDYYHGHVRELLSNYGEVDILWFDGLGYGGYYGRDARDWGAKKIFKAARQLQPDIIINNRCGLPGEFDTPEQTLGNYNFTRAWESVITFAGKQWSYKPDADIMSRTELIRAIAHCACGDGNLLLGIGPMSDGRIEPRQVERLTEVGNWLKKYGESIYDTRGGPFPTTTWGGTTYRDNTIYVHVMNWTNNVCLPKIKNKLLSSRLLTGEGNARVEQTQDGINISVEPADRDEADTVIELKFKRRIAPPPAPEKLGKPWTKEKAWDWYIKASPIVGCNYLPRTAINSIEMWQKESFDPEIIDEELGWAQNAGYNSIRVFFPYIVWKDDPKAFKKRLRKFLAIAWKHKIKTMPVLFDDCNFSGNEPALGDQGDPKPGIHNSGWLPSPGLKLTTDQTAWPDLELYIKDMVDTFGHDDRILMWDLYNEPGASDLWDKSLPLVEATFKWAREVKPKQPLTMGVWIKLDDDMSKRMMELSDVITFHGYDGPEGLEEKIQTVKHDWRPLICTECLARTVGTTFQATLPVFARDRVGWFNWGLVNGRTQTHIPWGSVKGSPTPEAWLHDVLHPDGRPYDPEEIVLIKKFKENWHK